MAQLPVREMVLYKHGVGFFVREGSLSGENTVLTFRQDEINDVLKSLAVFDRSGGQVLGIHYQTPMDKAARLASSSIRLSDNGSLHSLLAGLRGRSVELGFETASGTSEAIRGRVIGIDDPPRPNPQSSVSNLAEELISVLADDGQVRVFRLGALRALRIQDAQSSHDLTYFLDTSMSEDVRRTVNVRLSAGEHQLVVYYVAPSPTWRVSYRLVAEEDKEGEGNSGKALLQGWGLFDNRLEEDLENVQVTLVAGQPISFIYDLYASRIPTRPTVKDEARVAPGPVEFEGAFDELDDVELAASPKSAKMYARMERPMGAMNLPAAPAPAAFGASRPPSREVFAQSTPAAATAKEAGEFFQYEVTAPVSVKRGESALVPIIGSEIKYERELLYNRAKLPDHPVVALRFSNTTGLTLERGPVTVVENWDYKGEAVIPFTKDGNSVYVPFAVELGVRITENQKRDTETTGLNIKDAMMVFEQYETSRTTYFIENTTTKPVTIMIEAPKNLFWLLHDTPEPDIETATERRWKVSLPARAKTEFVTQLRQRTYRRENVQNLDYRSLQEFVAKGWLDDAIRGVLGNMLDEANAIQQANARVHALEVETGKLHKQQEQLRANLSTLQSTGEEAALRNRMLGQLESSQDRLEAIENEINNLNQLIADSEQKITEIVAGLG
ncbi:MAG: hypothetical protein GC179_30370 [Anaerolineaceae bacterium]|nr:hypothetical protein [Anaerolineaceae bacterium]